jgi:TrmH family RNA methyltransferase
MPEMIRVTSRDNARVKEAKRVRDGKQRDKIFIEGARLIGEAVRSEAKLHCLFVSDDGLDRNRELVGAANVREVFQLSDPVFRSIVDTVTSQGIAGLAERPATGRTELEKRLSTASVPLVAYLYHINNPSNLGAVIRTAEAAGVAGVIVSHGSADAFSPKAVRAAMGSSFRLPVWTDVGIDDAIVWSESNGLLTVATETTSARVYTDVDWRRPAMILFGSEAHGLPESVIQKVDDRIFIPMDKTVESLNLAVACGVILFEARRQNTAA